MGWANCGTDSKGRPIGYAHEATCDHPGCTEKIDRGLGYACGGWHGDGSPPGSCEGYFCERHSFVVERKVDTDDHMPRCVSVCGPCREKGERAGIWVEEDEADG